jgi:crossover junction endodeoxyribonuclease RuvC
VTTVVGIDPSLTATGLSVVVCDSGYVATQRLATKLRGHERLDWIVNNVGVWLIGARPDLAVIEGPSYGSTGSTYHQLAGLWWLVAHKVHSARVPYAIVTPQQRAKYATGKGGAAKDAVLLAVAKRYPDVEVESNDEADALLCAAMGARHLGRPIDDLPQTHLAAMDAVGWPELLSDDGDDAKVGAA